MDKRKLLRCFGIISIVIAIGLLAFAGYQWWQYMQADQEYEEIVEEFTQEDGEDEEAFWIDWDKVLAANPKTVGWIRMDSGANYPIVQGETNQYYLKRSFNGRYSVNGSIFMSSKNNPNWSDPNTVVYGHAMKSGSMFGGNRKYKDKSYYESHPYFYIYLPDGTCYTYHIFMTKVVNEGASPYTTVFTGQDDFSNFLKQMTSISMYNTGVNPTADKPIVTLSTCSGRSNRFIIQGTLESTIQLQRGETIK